MRCDQFAYDLCVPKSCRAAWGASVGSHSAELIRLLVKEGPEVPSGAAVSHLLSNGVRARRLLLRGGTYGHAQRAFAACPADWDREHQRGGTWRREGWLGSGWHGLAADSLLVDGLRVALCRTRVELDGQRQVLPWGELRVPVAAGWHQLRVSFRYLWMDCGAATKDLEVRGGQIVEVTYRAPWLVFLAGKLRVSREDWLLVAQETESALAGSAPPLGARPGWHTDPSDGHQRRWWDGERWTPAIFRSESRARKAWVGAVAVVTLIVTLTVVGAVVSDAQTDSNDPATLAESAEWVTVNEVDGVRFDMPAQPEHSTERIPGTDITVDLYAVSYDDLVMSATSAAAEVPGDTRTDAQKLDDAARGAAANIDGEIVSARATEVDGEPGLDFEVTTPQDGGTTVLGRVTLADDLLVLVMTVFHDDDRDVAAGPHDRMSRSLRFEG